MSEMIISSNLHHKGVRLQTHLQDVDVGNAVRAVAAAVDLDVFQPLDVRLGVTVNLTVELHVAAHHHCLIGRQASLEDGPVRRTLWDRKHGVVSISHAWKRCAAGKVDGRQICFSSISPLGFFSCMLIYLLFTQKHKRK